MQGGIKLSLLIGPEPEPASREVVEALASAQVQVAAGGSQAGFELTFDLAPRSPLRTQFLLSGGGSLKLMRVVLVVQIGGHAEPVIDGVVTNVDTQPVEGGVSKLVVKGKDLSALMDINDLPGPYSATSRKGHVELVLKRYAAFGVKPMVIKSIVEDTPLPTDRIPQQRGTDYAHVKGLAPGSRHRAAAARHPRAERQGQPIPHRQLL